MFFTQPCSAAYGQIAVDPDHPLIEAMQVTRLVALLTVLTQSAARPVSKVLSLLQGMKGQLESEARKLRGC